MRALFTIFGLLVVLIVLVLMFVGSGAYNIAAYNITPAEPHSSVVSWLFAAVRDRSIAMHSKEIQSPALTDPALIQAGFQEYHSMCLNCHGAPGHEPSAIGQGLNPKPPKLDAEGVQTRSDAELYWIVKNGIHMTGMPAFGLTHEEKELWSLVAFLRHLPHLRSQEYNAMVEAAGVQDGAEESDHHHSQAHAHSHEHGLATQGDSELQLE